MAKEQFQHQDPEPAYVGPIRSSEKALILIECALQGILPITKSKVLHPKNIKPGYVFIFESSENGKRWRDPLQWYPSNSTLGPHLRLKDASLCIISLYPIHLAGNDIDLNPDQEL